MMSRKPQAPPFTVRKKLVKEIHKALGTMKYGKGVAVLEKYQQSYIFDGRLLYALGILYDHRGMQITGTLGMSSEEVGQTSVLKRRARAEKYFQKAERIFRGLLKHDPKNVYALFRLGVLAELHGKYRKALFFKLKAHRLGVRDKSKKIPLLIDFTYLKMGKRKQAEEWCKKDLAQFGKNDTAAIFNALLFYFLVGEYEKALPYALKVESVLEHKTAQGFTSKKIVSLWKSRIRKVKREADKLKDKKNKTDSVQPSQL